MYPGELSLWEKLEAVATKVYHASEITASEGTRPFEGATDVAMVTCRCVLPRPLTLSTDPALKGAPDGHVMDIREVRLSVGAGFVVAICGDVMTMPGLPKAPASEKIDVVDGQIVGLFNDGSRGMTAHATDPRPVRRVSGVTFPARHQKTTLTPWWWKHRCRSDRWRHFATTMRTPGHDEDFGGLVGQRDRPRGPHGCRINQGEGVRRRVLKV